MSSKIKVDQIENTSGSGDVAFTGTGGIKLDTIKSSSGNSAITIASNGGIALSSSQQSAQSFRLSQVIAGTGALQMLTPFEEIDTDYTRVGSANWTVTAGAFSVATTGTYLCLYHLGSWIPDGSSPADIFDARIQLSTNSGASYVSRSSVWVEHAGGGRAGAVTNQFIFTVSNASAFRLRFVLGEDNAAATTTNIRGHSTRTDTGITFLKLGVL